VPGVDRITRASSLDSRGPKPAPGGRPPETPALPPLSPLDRLRLAAEVLSVYMRVRWGLWRGDLNTTLLALRASFWQGVRLAKATTRTLAVLPTDSRCLMQSLVLIGLLSRRRISSVLVIGVKSKPDFQAHAWVEHDDQPLLPSGEFRRLVEQ
jgi:Transglutaminase-like superfamily